MVLRPLAVLGSAALLAAVAGSAGAAGLTDVPRTIAKEPTYKGTPGYCLLVLGTDLKTKVWVVRDGDTVYVDRNGNGDLTEANEKVTATPEVEDSDEVKVSTTTFELGDLPLVGGKKVYGALELKRFLIEPKGHGAKSNESASLSVTLRETSSQSVSPKFAAKAADAPVVHFDGPLSVRIPPPPPEHPEESLTMGEEGQELTVQIGTLGLGDGTWAPMGYEQVPDDVKPVLEITFPPAKAGAAGVTKKFTLDDRC